MQIFRFVALLLMTSLLSDAETFFGYTTPTNRLIIGSNEAIVVYASNLDEVLFLKDGATNAIRLDMGDPASVRTPAFAGPAEFLLYLTNGLPPALVSFKRIKNGGIHTQVTEYGKSNVISVASNEVIRFFQPTLNNSDWQYAEFKRGTLIATMAIQNNLEVSGPMEITFFGAEAAGTAATFSYCSVGQFRVMPEFIEVPPGAFELRVEKSTDLTNWFSIVVNARSEDTKAFYRMRFDK